MSVYPGAPHVHHEPLVEGGAQLCPCGIATATPQTFTVASRPATPHRPRSSPPAITDRYAPPSSPDPPGSSWRPLLRGFTPLVSRVHLLVPLAEPAPSGSTDTSRRCRSCLPPSPASPGSGCSQLHRPAATGRRWRSFTPHSVRGASWRSVAKHQDLHLVGAVSAQQQDDQLQHLAHDQVPERQDHDHQHAQERRSHAGQTRTSTPVAGFLNGTPSPLVSPQSATRTTGLVTTQSTHNTTDGDPSRSAAVVLRVAMMTPVATGHPA
jgi:hypothetical protein